MYSLHLHICNLSMTGFSFAQRSHSRQPLDLLAPNHYMEYDNPRLVFKLSPLGDREQ